MERPKRNNGVSSQCLPATEGENAKDQCTCDLKKVSPRETENRRGITIIEEPVPDFTGPSPHEYPDPIFKRCDSGGIRRGTLADLFYGYTVREKREFFKVREHLREKNSTKPGCAL